MECSEPWEMALASLLTFHHDILKTMIPTNDLVDIHPNFAIREILHHLWQGGKILSQFLYKSGL